MTKALPPEDLAHIATYAKPALKTLENARIFITGGTGFFGVWLLESLVYANKFLNLNIKITVLTRDAPLFLKRIPHLSGEKEIVFYNGDVRDFIFPTEKFTHIIHAATPASAKLNVENPVEMLNVLLQGTQHVLDFAKTCDANNILFISSGAVYGRQPPEITHITEDCVGFPDLNQPTSAYAIGKKTAEYMVWLYNYQYQLNIKIARCFAFVGPHLPLDTHFAIGNFIRDALNGKKIEVAGDGTPYRSYQYAADLIVWLLHILCFGKKNVPYNVGSDEAITIKNLAEKVAQFSSSTVNILKDADQSVLPERYIPSIERAKKELNLQNNILLTEAIERTVRWHQQTEMKIV